MLVRGDQLEAALNKALVPVWLVSGDEPLLVDEAVGAIRTAARARGYLQREGWQADGDFDWPGWMAGFASLSLFASQRLVELRLPTGKPGVEGGKALEQWAERPPADTILLVILPRADKATQATRWFATLAGVGHVVTLVAPAIEQLPAWIERRLARHGLSAQADTLAWLAARVEGNLLAAHQEIEKLALLVPAGPLTLAAARAAVADVARYDVGDLADAFVKADAVRYCRVLDGLRAEGEALPRVLSVLTGDVRALYRLHHGLGRGRRLTDLMREAGVWQNRQPLLAQALKRLGDDGAAWALRGLARLDRAAKGAARADPWDELKQLGLALMRRGDAPAFARGDMV